LAFSHASFRSLLRNVIKYVRLVHGRTGRRQLVMPLLLLLLLYLACLGEHWPEPAWGIPWASFLTWSALLIVVLAAFLVAQRTRHRLRVDPQARETVLRRYSRFRFYHLMVLFVVYGLALYFLGWGWAVKDECTIARPDFLPLVNDDNLFL